MLTESDHDQYPTSWSSDGRMLLFMQATTDRSFDTFLLRLDGDGRPVGEPEVLVSSIHQDVHAVFSPDDRFVAYVSREAGKAHLYVRSLDGTARWQISENAGWGPRWLDSGRLYYHAWEGIGWQGDGAIRSVDFTIENGVPLPGQPKDVLNLPLDVVQATSAMFDIHPIDERLLVLSPTAPTQFEGRPNPILIQDRVQDLKNPPRP